MSRTNGDTLSQRKELLSSRAALERAQLSLALHDVGSIVSPRRLLEPGKRSRATAVATTLIGVGLPLLGRSRLSRILKTGSMLVTVWRITSNWRRAG